MTIQRVAIIILSILTATVLAYVLNFFVLERILIPDPCYYHARETNKIFDIFYDLPAFAGGHPFPTTFNFIFTLTIGAILGLTFSIIILKKRANAKHRP